VTARSRRGDRVREVRASDAVLQRVLRDRVVLVRGAGARGRRHYDDTAARAISTGPGARSCTGARADGHLLDNGAYFFDAAPKLAHADGYLADAHDHHLFDAAPDLTDADRHFVDTARHRAPAERH
jgi:hypothetical protein